MKLLVVVDVLLEVALNRIPFARDSGRLLTAVEHGRAEGYVAAHTITTAYYVVATNRGAAAARSVVAELLRILDVVPADRSDLATALSLGWRDFEDALQGVCAGKIGADFIVTRDLRDFRGSLVPAGDPASVLARF